MEQMERRFIILDMIVDEYIRTGEPVGSNALKAKLSIQASPATIRAEMAALETEGYLDHPHTSAGRVPTVRGYRLYIERMNIGQKRGLSAADRENIDAFFDNLYGQGADAVIESASRALSEATKCAVVTANMATRFSVITKVEVIPTGKRMYVLLLITSSGDIKNRVCRLQFDLTSEQMSFFQKFVGEHLEGVSAENISEDYLADLSIALGNYVMSLSPLLKAVADISGELKRHHILLEGQSHLIESEDLNKNQIIALLDRRSEFTELLDTALSGINVVFGQEGGGTFVVQNSSLISGNFLKDGKAAGSFGVIGPLRLDYKKIIPYLEYFTSKVTDILSGDTETTNEQEADGIE